MVDVKFSCSICAVVCLFLAALAAKRSAVAQAWVKKAAQGEFGLKDGLHPPLSQGLEMPYEFQQTQFTLVLPPEVCPYLWAERIIEHNEEHTTIQIT